MTLYPTIGLKSHQEEPAVKSRIDRIVILLVTLVLLLAVSSRAYAQSLKVYTINNVLSVTPIQTSGSFALYNGEFTSLGQQITLPIEINTSDFTMPMDGYVELAL